MFNKIKEYFATMGWLGLQPSTMRLDLQKHGLVGLAMVIPFFMGPYFILEMDKLPALIVATMLSFAVAYYKESGDSVKKGNIFSWLDLIVTVGFTIMGSLLVMIFI